MFVDEYRFARRHIAHQLEREHVECDVLGGEHVLGTARRAALAEHERADAVRIAKAQDAVADHHGDDRITTAAAPIHGAHGCEDIRRRHARRTDALQLGGEHVQQHFGIRLGIEVAPILANQNLGQFLRIGQIAVVGQADAIRCVDIERLRFGGTVAAGGWITHVADTDVAGELEHVLLLEHIAHQACALARAEPTLESGHDAGGVLTTVLQHRQRIIQTLIDRAGADHPDDTAHD